MWCGARNLARNGRKWGTATEQGSTPSPCTDKLPKKHGPLSDTRPHQAYGNPRTRQGVWTNISPARESPHRLEAPALKDLPIVTRATPLPVAPSFVPIEFATPGLTVRQLAAMLQARWRIFVLVLVCGWVGTAALLWWWPRSYTATAVLSVNYAVNDPQNGEDLPMGQLGSYIATQIALLQTREVLVRTGRALGLAQRKSYRDGYRPDRGTLDDWVASRLARKLAVFRAADGGQLIYVSYTAHTPEEAAVVANTIVNSYRLAEDERVASAPRERTARQAAQLAELKRKVDEAQARVTAFSTRASLVNAGGAMPIGALVATEANLVAARAATHAAEARLANALSPAGAAATSDQVQTLLQLQDEQDAQLAKLNYDFTPKHPSIARLATERATTHAQLEAAMQAVQDDARAAVRAAQQMESSLATEVNRQRGGMILEGVRRDEAAQLRLALESAQVVYRRALEGYDAVVFAAETNRNNVTVASPAAAPVEPLGGARWKLAGMGLLGSLVMALLVPLLLELTRRRVLTSADLERDHGLPVLGELTGTPLWTSA